VTLVEQSSGEVIVSVPVSAVEIELFELLQTVIVRNPPSELTRVGVRDGVNWRKYGEESAYAFFDAVLRGVRALVMGTVETWVFADGDEELTIRGMLAGDDLKPATLETDNKAAAVDLGATDPTKLALGNTEALDNATPEPKPAAHANADEREQLTDEPGRMPLSPANRLRAPLGLAPRHQKIDEIIAWQQRSRPNYRSDYDPYLEPDQQ
jgi:hypothetical protein